MAKSKTTKRALFSSIVVLILCFTMLLGTTFAWFTDTASTAVNTIQSGTLKVDLVDTDDVSLEGRSLTLKGKDNAYFEPGATFATEEFKVKNNGNLALKFKLALNGIEATGETSTKLLEVLTFNVVDADGTAVDLTTFEGHLTAGQSSDIYTIQATMDKEAGNDYQNLSVTGIGITVYATQDTVESDMTDDQYDKDAEYPAVVANAAELASALAAGKKNVTLVADVKLENETLAVAAGQDIVIDLGGNTLATVNTEAKASAAINNKGTLTLKNGTVTYEGVGDSDSNYGTNTIHNTGKLVIDGATIINTTTSGSSPAIDCAEGAELIINSGVIESQKNAIRLCPFADGAINCTINGGKITGANAVQIQLPANRPDEAPEINLTVNGGTLIASNEATRFAIFSNSSGQSVDNVNVTINNGTFDGYVVFGSGNAADQEHVTITGGTFIYGVWRLDGSNWVEITTP